MVGLGVLSLDAGCDICWLRLQECPDLLNPQDQHFDGTNTSFGLGGPGGGHEFLQCFSVQIVTWAVSVTPPSFRRQVSR